MNRDLKNNIVPVQVVTPALNAADLTGLDVDLKDYDSCALVINPGIVTDGVHLPKVLESDDGITYTDAAAVDVEGAFVALVTDTVQWVGYKGNKQYVTLFVTVTGSPSTGGIYGATCIKGDGHARP